MISESEALSDIKELRELGHNAIADTMQALWCERVSPEARMVLSAALAYYDDPEERWIGLKTVIRTYRKSLEPAPTGKEAVA